MRNRRRPSRRTISGSTPCDARLEHRRLPHRDEVRLELGLRLEVRLLDARRVDAAVLEELLERQPRELAPDAVEGRQHDRVRRVVDDEVDAGQVLQRADVASLAADDAALHVVRRQLHDGHRRLRGVAGGQPLHRDGQDRAHAPLRLALRVLLHGPQDLRRVVARGLLDVAQERLLGLRGAHAGGALQGAGLLLAQALELGPLAGQLLRAGAEVRVAAVERGLPALQRALERLDPLAAPGQLGVALAAAVDGRRDRLGHAGDGDERRGPAGPAGAEQQRGGHEASRQHDRCDDDAHCPVLSLGTGAMPGPGLVVVVTGRAAGPRRRLGGSAVRPGRTSAGAGEGDGRRAQARGAELPDGRVVVGCRKGAVCWGFAAPEGRTFAAPDSSAGGAGAQSEPRRAGDAGRPSRRQPSRSKRRTAW